MPPTSAIPLHSVANDSARRTFNHLLRIMTTRIWLSYVLIIFWGANTSTNAAELTFKSPTATFTAPVEASGCDVSFSFSNTSSETISITDIHLGCGCMTSALEKRIYQPGETGSIAVHVDFQDRTGPIRKSIWIMVKGSLDKKETEQRLKIDGVALSPLALSSLTVSWSAGENATKKDILVSINKGYEVTDLAVEDGEQGKSFQVQSRRQANGELVVSVTPASTQGNLVSLVDGHDFQQLYHVTYTLLPSNLKKRERFYAIIYKP